MHTGRLLAIDHGIKRIGVAVCDASRLIARELTIITRKSKKEDFALLNQIAERERVVGIVVGLPTNFEAAPGTYTQADTVRLWVERYKETTDLKIILWDEQLSSEEARSIGELQNRKYDDHIDDLAARVILQTYLDAVRDGLATSFEEFE